MIRYLTISALALVLVAPLHAQAPTAEQKQATLTWIQALQDQNGAFRADKKSESTLPATLQGIRATKYFGGQVKNLDGVKKFVMSCYVKKLSGYAAQPGSMDVDARMTSLGLMAAGDLKLLPADYVVPATITLCSSVKKYEDIRLAAAAYESVNTKCELASDWVSVIDKMQNPDGTFGTGAAAARETGGAVVALMRLGAKVEKKDNVLKALKAGQLSDGGWGKDKGTSDLESSYRVLRAFVMFKERPDVEAARKFIASCRHADGSYGVRPGEPGTLSATYFAGIISHWLDGMK